MKEYNETGIYLVFELGHVISLHWDWDFNSRKGITEHGQKRNGIFLFFDLYCDLFILTLNCTEIFQTYVGLELKTEGIMSVEFVVGSRLALRVFLRVLRFSPLHKNLSKFQLCHYRGPTWKPTNADVASILNIVILITKDD